jgi:hypothetical protein
VKKRNALRRGHDVSHIIMIMRDSNDGAPTLGEPVPGTNNEDAPVIIWTFRRTGGTSLKTILFWLSTRASWQDEAFNRDRELGSITKAYEESGDLDQLSIAVGEIVGQNKNLKHCVETVPHEITSRLLRLAEVNGYKHIVLLRRNEEDRQISLALALITKAWGPSEAAEIYQRISNGTLQLEPINLGWMQKHIDRDAIALGKLIRLFAVHDISYRVVFFEDLYTGPFARRSEFLKSVISWIGLRRASTVGDEAFKSVLMERSQKTDSILSFVPNLDEVRGLIRRQTD